MTDRPDIAYPGERTSQSGSEHVKLACFSSLGCPDLTLVEAVSLARKYGLTSLELRTLGGSMDLPGYLAGIRGGWESTASYLLEQGMQVRVLGTSLKLSENSEKERAEFLGYARLAEALSAPYLRVFGGGLWPTPLGEDAWNQAIETCLWWQRIKEEVGFKCELLLETHDAFSGSSPCLELMDRLGSPLHLIWDSHHTWRLGGEMPQVSWERLQAHVRHIHFKDSIEVPSARHPFTYVLPGSGEMPVEEFWAVLEAGHYDGVVSLEWEKKWHPYLPDLQEALEACMWKGWLGA